MCPLQASSDKRSNNLLHEISLQEIINGFLPLNIIFLLRIRQFQARFYTKISIGLSLVLIETWLKTPSRMYNVAIIGSGPSGLFLAKNLLKCFPDSIKIDIFERISAPMGLLKFGVAPDQPEVKVKLFLLFFFEILEKILAPFWFSFKLWKS